MNIGESIRHFRKEKGLTQKELGELLKVSPQMIAQYERGARNPKKETLQKIATALNVSPYDFLNDNLFNALTDHTLSDKETVSIIEQEFDLIKNNKSLNDNERSKKIDQLQESLELGLDEQIKELVIIQGFLLDPGRKGDKDRELLERIEAVRRNMLIEFYDQLNDYGRAEAVKRVRDLTYNPEYQRKTEAPSADRPPAEPPANEGQPPAGADPRQGNAQDNNQDNE